MNVYWYRYAAAGLQVLLATSEPSTDATVSILGNVTNTTSAPAKPKDPSDDSNFHLSILISTLIPLFKLVRVVMEVTYPLTYPLSPPDSCHRIAPNV